MSSYDARDQDAFFGRSAEIAEGLARLERHPLLVLTGPSGSGKSSLMLAGLAPALVRRGRAVVAFTPGVDPAVAMSTARVGVPGDPILLIDQFEETFTLAGPASDPVGWLAELASYAESRSPVAVTLRADQMAHLTVSPDFARMAGQGVLLVAPLQGQALREAIEEPARRAGLRLEHGLVDLLIRDAEGQPGALPLLSHALVETWQRRDGGLLTVEGYVDSGGLRGAVAASADRLYESLSDAERVQLRRVMLRMVSLSDAGEPVRSRLPAAAVADDPARLRVLERLARARLVTTDQKSYELAHEALARAWPRLRSWLDESVEEQQLVRHLAASAAGWDALGRPDSELYRGARLQGATEWLSGEDADPTPLEREFLATSQARADDASLAKERQIRHERRQNRGCASCSPASPHCSSWRPGSARWHSTAAVTPPGSATWPSSRPRRRRTRRSWAARSPSGRPTAAWPPCWPCRPSGPGRTHLSQSALLASFIASPGFLGYRYLEGDDRLNAAGIPNTQRAVVAGTSSHLGLLSITTGTLTHPFGAPLPRALDYSVLRVSKDANRVAQLVFTPRDPDRCGNLESLADRDGRGCSSLVVHDIATGERLLGPVELPFSGGDVAISDYGDLVAVAGGYDGDLVTYDVATGRRLGRLPGLPRPVGVEERRDTAAVAFDASGDVYLGSMAGPIRQVDPRTLEVRRTFPAPRLSSHVGLVVVTANNVLVAAGNEALLAVDLVSGRRLWVADLRGGLFPEPCPFFAVAEGVGRVYCGNHFGQVEERDLATGQRTDIRLDPQLGSVGDLVVAGSEGSGARGVRRRRGGVLPLAARRLEPRRSAARR